ncbi:hypothetical protein J3Q64DRAFT_1821263 [Phycomyces blakesleeanus]|uniref:Uncharacterized protein n=2 Tax=Phycomyces blakesleeanus TaxID=4837 RepID=A0A162PYR1_PHYB8|nr:hypothetical protein PHYBLDRAFT_166773 [Phycomyces blakesleeanus NRRL 1555(-)]OAD75536.1 hypothetical protein PHYBLDRAFT_166773 [Phycomyces blakesleeanus NRRL 1555(-)]|eukprot:XP_018293576.1 hypothetical protein PHYBLDRAFT_166773 [Phycomyces blakesleeanus NRRL 1555(-)]
MTMVLWYYTLKKHMYLVNNQPLAFFVMACAPLSGNSKCVVVLGVMQFTTTYKQPLWIRVCMRLSICLYRRALKQNRKRGLADALVIFCVLLDLSRWHVNVKCQRSESM